MYDLFKAGVSMDFVDEVSASLTPGKAAVVADIDEMWVTPIDTRLGRWAGRRSVASPARSSTRS